MKCYYIAIIHNNKNIVWKVVPENTIMSEILSKLYRGLRKYNKSCHIQSINDKPCLYTEFNSSCYDKTIDNFADKEMNALSIKITTYR